jgi:hypothetical protein
MPDSVKDALQSPREDLMSNVLPLLTHAESNIVEMCQSAWGPDADRRAKLLIFQAMEGSILDAYLQSAIPRGAVRPAAAS